MEGYSVDEAAAVLGVPQARVWELLARGILAGAERAGDMRVYLRQETSRAPAPGPTNGNGHDTEQSAFRELLTEFRNLTERYGQALLALGEARGEVAALRGRVDQLEARFDRGLPGPMPVSTLYQPEEAAPDPSAVVPAVPADEPEVEAEPAPPSPPRVRAPAPRGRKRIPPLGEALARADDPTPSGIPGEGERELPGARAAAAALSEFRGEAETPAWEPAAPPPAALVEGPYSAVVEEPDWIAEEDLLPMPDPALIQEEPQAGPQGATASPQAVEGSDEFETANSSWQTAVPPLPPLFGQSGTEDPLVQVAADQGWAPDEVEAMRQLLAEDAAIPEAIEADELTFEGDEPGVVIEEVIIEAAPVVEPPPRPSPAPRQVPPPRPRRTAAQRATRRLRRLLGG